MNLTRKPSQMSLSKFDSSGNKIDDITNYMNDTKNSYQSTVYSTFHAKHRQDLSIYASRETIMGEINENPVVIIRGQTGCGKVRECSTTESEFK